MTSFKNTLKDFLNQNFYESEYYFKKWHSDFGIDKEDYYCDGGIALADLSYCKNEDEFFDWIRDYIRDNKQLIIEDYLQEIKFTKEQLKLFIKIFKIDTTIYEDDLKCAVLENNQFCEWCYQQILRLLDVQ